jgi:hypothetical protein
MPLNKHECDNMASPWGLECTELCYRASHVPSQCTAACPLPQKWHLKVDKENMDRRQLENTKLVKSLQNLSKTCSSLSK